MPTISTPWAPTLTTNPLLRDNRALGQHIKNCGIKPLIPMATDESNKAHTALQVCACVCVLLFRYLYVYCS
jgi:hypothetical protein